MLFTAAMAPVATYTRTHLQTQLNTVHAKIQSDRIQLTRLQQDLHLLQQYANELRVNQSLRSMVMNQARDGSPWQTPMGSTRLALQDAVSELSDVQGEEPLITIDWLDQLTSSELDERQSDQPPSRRLWLSATVLSVPSGIELLRQLSAIAAPYPLAVRGCGYRQAHDSSTNRDSSAVQGPPRIEMRCLLTLAAWKLPLVRIEDADADGDGDGGVVQVQAGVSRVGHQTALVDADQAQWRLFKVREEGATRAESVVADQSPRASRKKTEKSPKPADPLAKLATSIGVFKGPAGTLVIHGQ